MHCTFVGAPQLSVPLLTLTLTPDPLVPDDGAITAYTDRPLQQRGILGHVTDQDLVPLFTGKREILERSNALV